MGEGILVGRARVQIVGDARNFIRDLKATLKTELSLLDTRVALKPAVDAPSVAKARAALGPVTGKKTVPLMVGVDPAALAKAQGELADLGKRVASPSLALNDKAYLLGLADATVRLDRLGAKVADPKITLAGLHETELGILQVSAALDKLDAKAAATGTGGAGIGGLLTRLAGGGAAGGAAGAGASTAGGAAAAGAGAGIATGLLAGLPAAAAGALGIVPALTAAGAGLVSFAALAIPTLKGVTTAYAGLNTATDAYQLASQNLNIAIHKSPADMALYRASLAGLEPDLRGAAALLTNQNVLWQNLSPAVQKSVVALSNNKAAVKGLLPDQARALTALLGQKAAYDAINPAQRTAVTGLQSLSTAFGKMVTALSPITFKVFNDALGIANKLLPTLLPFATAAGTALDGLFKSAGRFLRTSTTSTFDVWSAKLHGFRTVTVSTLTPFGQFVKQMTALSGPAITAIGQGLGQIAIASGKLLMALVNPNSIKALRVLLGGVALAITGVANVISWSTPRLIAHFHQWAQMFDATRHAAATFGHDVAVVFDKVRHTVAADVHQISDWIDTIRVAAVRTGHGVETAWNTLMRWNDVLRHNIWATFDHIRHDIASIWNTIWNNTVGRVQRGVGDVMRWVGSVPGAVRHDFASAGTWLVSGGRNIITGLWDGVKAVWHDVTGWFSGLPHAIMHALGIASPPAWAIDSGKHIMSGLLKGVAHGAADVSGFFRGLATSVTGPLKAVWGTIQNVGGSIGSFFGHLLGGGGQPSGTLQQYAQQLLDAHGWGSQFGDLNYIIMRESGWQVGATNPSSGAYGIPQALPGSKMAAAGPDWATSGFTQLRWMIDDYIGQAYGSPAAAAAHERAVNWYDNGGWLPKGLSLAANHTGSPELVLTADQLRNLGSGGTVNYNANFPDAWAAGALESKVRAAFTAMSMNDTRRHRLGRQQ